MADYSKPKAAAESVATKSLSSVGYMQVRGPLLCLNGHITVKHLLQREYTPSWCNTEGCEWYWGTQEKNPTSKITTVNDLASEGVADSTNVSNPPSNATLSNLEGRDGDSK